MNFRTFFFLLFIFASSLFFFSSLNPQLTLKICGAMCYDKYSLSYIQLTSMFTSAIALVLFITSNYYVRKRFIHEQKRLIHDRLNIEQIHAELEALKI